MILALIFFAIFLFSWVLTLWLRRYALSSSLIDVPNARSSHSVPTPRGGGVAVVVSYCCGLLAFFVLNLVNQAQLCALLGAGGLVAVIGFADDHGHLAARWRLAGHFIAGAWALFWLNGLAPVTLFGSVMHLGVVGDLAAVVYLVWMLNLYNFMDGIDGLASVEAICACIGSALVFWFAGYDNLIWAPSLLAVAVLGFFCWNFPPAKIFMGDAGSGYLGITLAVISLIAAWESPSLLFVWLIMLAVFVVDATWTLLRRLVRGEAVYQAHRSHAYQYASRKFNSHKKVTLTIALINILWLWPIALFVGLSWLDPLIGVLVAYMPLIGVACYFRAGSLGEDAINHG